jgi:DNA-binding MarR family transcriptional regulator
VSVKALSDADYRAHAEFRYAMRRYLHVSEEQARMRGVTPQQLLLLLAVRGHPSYPAVSISEIAERLQVRHHSASLLVERSVRRDLLSREQDQQDRRRAMVSLTPYGMSVLEEIMLANRRELRKIEGILTAIVDSLDG